MKSGSTLRERSRSRWDVLRQRILRRDAGLCQPCQLAGRLRLAAEVDHVRPIAQGGTDDEDNLQSICADCHRDKTAAEQGYRVRPTIGLDGWPVSAVASHDARFTPPERAARSLGARGATTGASCGGMGGRIPGVDGHGTVREPPFSQPHIDDRACCGEAT